MGRRRRSSMIKSKPSPRNQWNVSSMVAVERFTQRSSMSMAMNVANNGLSSGASRLACSDIIVARVDVKAVLISQAASDGRFAGSAAATDPEHALQPFSDRRCICGPAVLIPHRMVSSSCIAPDNHSTLRRVDRSCRIQI